MVSFNTIPSNLLVPGTYIEIDNSKAVNTLSVLPAKVLVIGQKLAAGTADALKAYLITSKDQAKQLFGNGSQLAHMLERFIDANEQIEVWAIAQIDNVAGAAATGNLAFTGPATAAGTLYLRVGGRSVEVGVNAADTAAAIATAVVAAISADPTLAVTAAVDGAVISKVNLTAKHKGVSANDIDIRFNYYSGEAFPAGITCAVTAMNGGTGNPEVTAVIDAIADVWYTGFIMGYNDTANIVAMENELLNRFGPLKMTDGHLYAFANATNAALVTLGDARNSPMNSIMGGYKCPLPPYEMASIYGAICEASAEIDPARPVQTLVMTGALAPADADRFDWQERNILLQHGIATFNVAADGTVAIERVVTTYKTNAFGASDPSYRDLETMKTLAYLRYDTRTFIAQRFPRYKLADDGNEYPPGQAIVTPSIIRAALIGRAAQWFEEGLVENLSQFKTDLIVQRNAQDVNRVDTILPPDIINQLRVTAAQIQYSL